MFKLGFLFYKKVILTRIMIVSRNIKHKDPIMEYAILFGLTLGFDFILVVWVENNQDYIYVILVFVVGLVTLLNTFRIREWPAAIIKGKGIILYDCCLVGILCYAFFFIPDIITIYTDSYGI